MNRRSFLSSLLGFIGFGAASPAAAIAKPKWNLSYRFPKRSEHPGAVTVNHFLRADSGMRRVT